MQLNENFRPGEVAYIIIRNPHTQNVAHVQQAAVVDNPNDFGQLALFIHETYYPLTDDVAVFRTEKEAEQVFDESFGPDEEGELFG